MTEARAEGRRATRWTCHDIQLYIRVSDDRKWKDKHEDKQKQNTRRMQVRAPTSTVSRCILTSYHVPMTTPTAVENFGKRRPTHIGKALPYRHNRRRKAITTTGT